MDLKFRQALAREFARELAVAFAGPLASELLAPRGEHKAVEKHVKLLLAGFLARHALGDEVPFVDWEGKDRNGVAQQQSYPLLGTWTHPDLAVVAPFTVAVEFDRENDNWVGYKQSLMKAACHAMSGAYDAVLHVFILKYGDSSQSIYLQDDDAPTTFKGDKANAFTRQLMASLTAQGVVPAFVPAGPGAPLADLSGDES